jgi:hypothetical protein
MVEQYPRSELHQRSKKESGDHLDLHWIRKTERCLMKCSLMLDCRILIVCRLVVLRPFVVKYRNCGS